MLGSSVWKEVLSKPIRPQIEALSDHQKESVKASYLVHRLVLMMDPRLPPSMASDGRSTMAEMMARYWARHLAAYLAHPKGIGMGIGDSSSTWLVAWILMDHHLESTKVHQKD